MATQRAEVVSGCTLAGSVLLPHLVTVRVSVVKVCHQQTTNSAVRRRAGCQSRLLFDPLRANQVSQLAGHSTAQFHHNDVQENAPHDGGGSPQSWCDQSGRVHLPLCRRDQAGAQVEEREDTSAGSRLVYVCPHMYGWRRHGSDDCCNTNVVCTAALSPCISASDRAASHFPAGRSLRSIDVLRLLCVMA